jgi:cytochrome c-type biogenesis protein
MGIESLITSGPLIAAIPVAAAAGAITFLSPCCLPLIPGYLSYLTGMSGADAQQADAQQADAGPVPASPAAGGQAAAAVPAHATQVSMAGQAGTAAQAGQAGAGAQAGQAGTGTQTDLATAPGGTERPGGVDVGTEAARGGRAKGGQAGTANPAGRGRTVLGTLLFVLGFSALFASYGAAFGGLGQLLQTHQRGLVQVLGGLTILLGLLFAGLFDRFAFAGRMVKPSVRPRAGLAGAPVLGVMFGLGWTPCIGPTLTAVLGLATTTGTAGRGAFLAFVYGLGLGIPFLIVAAVFQRGVRGFGFARRHARAVMQVGGGLLVVVGILQVTGAWTVFMSWLKIHWVSEYNSPI